MDWLFPGLEFLRFFILISLIINLPTLIFRVCDLLKMASHKSECVSLGQEALMKLLIGVGIVTSSSLMGFEALLANVFDCVLVSIQQWEKGQGRNSQVEQWDKTISIDGRNLVNDGRNLLVGSWFSYAQSWSY